MKSFLVPVIIALFGFALVTLADMDDLETEEAKISEDFESGMFDEFISVVTEINDSDENADDEDAEDTAGGQDRVLQCAWCRLRCMAQCTVAPNATCSCTKMFLGIFPISTTSIPCS